MPRLPLTDLTKGAAVLDPREKGRGEFVEPRRERRTFPNDQDAPAKHSQLGDGRFVSLDVAFKFCSPKVRSRAGNSCKAASLVNVPETAVNEDGDSSAWQHNIGNPREILAMKSIPKSGTR